MARSIDVVIGIDVGSDRIGAVASTTRGAEFGTTIQLLPPHAELRDRIELDPIALWQAVAAVVQKLAALVPDLGRRTVALGVTGSIGGLCLVDEDGEPVQPIVLAARAGSGDLADRPDETDRVLARMIATGAADVDRAAHALDIRGWALACLTGRPLVPPQLTPRGGPVDGESERLLPAEAPQGPVPLRSAAAAASGLWDGTPVVAAPPAAITAALAAGLADPERSVGLALLETETWLVRAARRDSRCTMCPWWPDLPGFGSCRGEIGGNASDWLVEVAQNLLADAGLIGLTGADLSALLERSPSRTSDDRPTFRRSEAGAAGTWAFDGLDRTCGLAGLADAVHAAIAHGCRTGFEALGGPPDEVRAAGRLTRKKAIRSLLPDALGVPTRLLQRTAPAANGAALCALRAIGEVEDLAASAGDWVDPFLGPLLRPDDDGPYA